MNTRRNKVRKAWTPPAIIVISKVIQSGTHNTLHEATLVPAPGGLLRSKNGTGGYFTSGLFAYVHS